MAANVKDLLNAAKTAARNTAAAQASAKTTAAQIAAQRGSAPLPGTAAAEGQNAGAQ